MSWPRRRSCVCVCVSRSLPFFDARMVLVSPIRVCTTVCRARWHVLALKIGQMPAPSPGVKPTFDFHCGLTRGWVVYR